MPWTLVILGVVFVVGTIVWTTLDPVAQWMLDYALSQNDGQAASKGVASVRTAWDYWPLWFLGILGAFGIIESIRKSGSRGGI